MDFFPLTLEPFHFKMNTIKCGYETVNTEDAGDVNQKIRWKYFIRQVIFASAVWTLFFVAGLCIGLPTVLMPQLRKEANGVAVDEEIDSWIHSAFGIVAIPWGLIVPSLTAKVGRKIPYLICCSSMMTAFIVLYFSVTPYHVLISEVLQGFCHACNITITVLIVTEYSSTRYRGVFLTIKAASFYWGIWCANAIGTFFHWRYVAVAGIVSSVYTLSGAFYPESPHWLASKGKYEKCKESFRWLHGTDEASEKELRNILDSHIQNRKELIENKNKESLRKSLTSKQFYKPLILSIIMGVQYHFSGKLVCSTYAIEVIKRMTGDEATAYSAMLILDGVTVFGMYLGSILSKSLKRRTLYMPSSFVGVAFLLLLSAYLYFVKLGICAENNTISVLLLTVYSVCISCGPMIMSMTISGEIISLKYQAICYPINATTFSVLFTVLMKFAPYFFKELGMHGSFLLYGLTAGVLTGILYFYLPETKDKTLLEIEEYFKDKGIRETSSDRHE